MHHAAKLRISLCLNFGEVFSRATIRCCVRVLRCRLHGCGGLCQVPFGIFWLLGLSHFGFGGGFIETALPCGHAGLSAIAFSEGGTRDPTMRFNRGSGLGRGRRRFHRNRPTIRSRWFIRHNFSDGGTRDPTLGFGPVADAGCTLRRTAASRRAAPADVKDRPSRPLPLTGQQYYTTPVL